MRRLGADQTGIEEYLLLHRAGAFQVHSKTELVDGTIYEMSPQHCLYGCCKDGLVYRLTPDIILTSEPRGDGAIPVGSVALLVEIPTNTLRFDLDDKARAYPAAGVPEYRVADLNGKVIHQFWAPADGTYTGRREVAFSAPGAAVMMPGLMVETDGI